MRLGWILIEIHQESEYQVTALFMLLTIDNQFSIQNDYASIRYKYFLFRLRNTLIYSSVFNGYKMQQYSNSAFHLLQNCRNNCLPG